MPSARSNGIDIDYEDLGPKTGKPLVLVMGLGASLVFWEDGFCDALARRGHRVIRFDNRDVGRSTKLDALGMPNVGDAVSKLMMRQPITEAPYRLSDMARDTIGLMDHLAIDRAHVVGVSMGGMIAQTLAIEHPKRLASMTSIMSSTGDPTLPPAKPEAMAHLLTPPPSDRAGYLEHSLVVWKTIGGLFPMDPTRVRARAAAHFDRGYHPPGVARQLVGILASGDRTAALRSVRVPSLVIHGVDDPLVPVEAGKATAAAIPGAKLVLIEKMGHDLVPETWPQVVDAVSTLTASAG